MTWRPTSEGTHSASTAATEDQPALVRHVEAVADSVPLPFPLYNIRSASGNAFDAWDVPGLVLTRDLADLMAMSALEP